MVKKKKSKNVSEFKRVSVDEAKVASVVYKFYNVNRVGFLKDGDKLIHVTVTSVHVDLKNQNVTTVLTDANGNTYERNKKYDLFLDEEKFKCNNPLTLDNYNTYQLLQRADWERLCECACPEVDVDEENHTKNTYLVVWTFENGEAIKTPVLINSVAKNNENGWHLVDGSLPERFWENRKDAYSFNEYKVVDEDGEEFVERGVNLRLMLNDEQYDIIKTLKATFKQAVDAGVKFLWDRDNLGHVMAYNGTEVVQFGYDIADSRMGCGVVVKVDEMIPCDTGIHFYDYNGCDENDYIELKATPREQKRYDKTQKKD